MACEFAASGAVIDIDKICLVSSIELESGEAVKAPSGSLPSLLACLRRLVKHQTAHLAMNNHPSTEPLSDLHSVR